MNHSIFWTNLLPPKDYAPPAGELASAINAQFGGLEKLVAKISAEAVAVQGAGWGVSPG